MTIFHVIKYPFQSRYRDNIPEEIINTFIEQIIKEPLLTSDKEIEDIWQKIVLEYEGPL